nr:hypothetical protein [uncultured Lichenicoccus sp.]
MIDPLIGSTIPTTMIETKLHDPASFAALDRAAVENQFPTTERLPWVVRHQRKLAMVTTLIGLAVLAFCAFTRSGAR